MAKSDKLLARMRVNPKGDWTIDDVLTVCAHHGIICIAPRGGGSHYKLAHDSHDDIVTVPARRPIKPVYIRDVVKLVDHVISRSA